MMSLYWLGVDVDWSKCDVICLCIYYIAGRYCMSVTYEYISRLFFQLITRINAFDYTVMCTYCLLCAISINAHVTLTMKNTVEMSINVWTNQWQYFRLPCTCTRAVHHVFCSWRTAWVVIISYVCFACHLEDTVLYCPECNMGARKATCYIIFFSSFRHLFWKLFYLTWSTTVINQSSLVCDAFF